MHYFINKNANMRGTPNHSWKQTIYTSQRFCAKCLQLYYLALIEPVHCNNVEIDNNYVNISEVFVTWSTETSYGNGSRLSSLENNTKQTNLNSSFANILKQYLRHPTWSCHKLAQFIISSHYQIFTISLICKVRLYSKEQYHE